jgi:hypothetical protein
VPSHYRPIPGIGAAFISAATGYAFGIRGISLLVFIGVFWFPLTVFLFGVLKMKSNPRITEFHQSLTA